MLGSFRGLTFRVLAGVIAVICIAAGIYLNFFHSRGFVKTTAEIVSLIAEENADGDEVFFPKVEYTVDGRTYTAELDTSSPSYKVGKTLSVRYDPNDPSVVHGGQGVEIYILVLGVVILAVCILSAIREKQSQKQVQELRESRGQTSYRPSVQGEERELYFLTDLGTPKYGHRLEDAGRRVLYEAKMTKFTLTQPFGFDFIDHEHGTAVPHLVGHSEETDWNSLLIDNHNTFELDGVDVWKHLKQNGVSVSTNYTAGGGRVIGMDYRIFRDGAEIARAESASQYPHEEDAAKHKVAAAIMAQGFYRVWTREQNLDLLFVTLLAFARSGAGDDRGGTFGAMVGTLNKNSRNDQ